MFPLETATISVARGTTPLDTRSNYLVDLEWPAAGNGRSRKVISRSNSKSSTGRYPSVKLGRGVHYESPGERNAFRFLDVTPSVTRYQEQPVTVHYVLDDTRTYHRPDILVEFEHRRELWEVKTEAQARDRDVLLRSRLMQQALPRFGFTYRLINADELEKQSRLSVIIDLLRFAREPVGDLAREQMRRLFKVRPEVEWQRAASGQFGPHGREALARLTVEGYLRCDTDDEMSGATLFMLNSSNDSAR